MYFDIGEFYPFRMNGSVYFMALPSCSIWRGDAPTMSAMEELKGRTGVSEDELATILQKHITPDSLTDVIDGLKSSQILLPSGGGSGHDFLSTIPVEPGSVTHLICNVSHSCNLTCRYCYADNGRYGGDATFIDEETARRYVDFLLEKSGKSDRVFMTFFGGEPLLNFPVIESTVNYGLRRASECGKTIAFDLTTNATLLDDKKIRFLNDNRILVTVSIDGPREVHDYTRIRADGTGTYETVIRNVLPFLKSRPVPARVTLTRKSLKVKEIIDHLLGIGFFEVGISPVDVTEEDDLGLRDEEMATLSAEFARAADNYLDMAIRGEYYGFTNVTNLLKQLHEGISKAYPCGAGMRLYAGDPDGQLYMCHRLVGRSAYSIGDLETGIDTEKQVEFLRSVSVFNKSPCRDCWIRYICSGGCYYQSVLHYNDHTRTYTPKCEWLRLWFHKCLEIYVTLLERNPSFIERQTGDSLLC